MVGLGALQSAVAFVSALRQGLFVVALRRLVSPQTGVTGDCVVEVGCGFDDQMLVSVVGLSMFALRVLCCEFLLEAFWFIPCRFGYRNLHVLARTITLFDWTRCPVRCGASW